MKRMAEVEQATSCLTFYKHWFIYWSGKETKQRAPNVSEPNYIRYIQRKEAKQNLYHQYIFASSIYSSNHRPTHPSPPPSLHPDVYSVSYVPSTILGFENTVR